jgi:hypothetical protein
VGPAAAPRPGAAGIVAPAGIYACAGGTEPQPCLLPSPEAMPVTVPHVMLVLGAAAPDWDRIPAPDRHPT